MKKLRWCVMPFFAEYQERVFPGCIQEEPHWCHAEPWDGTFLQVWDSAPSDSNTTRNQALSYKRALPEDSTMPLRKSRKETGGGRIEVLFGIFQGFCSFRVKFQWILNIDNAQRYLSAWSKHVKTHEFWTNKESQILAEAPCLYSSHKRNDCERQ